MFPTSLPGSQLFSFLSGVVFDPEQWYVEWLIFCWFTAQGLPQSETPQQVAQLM